MTISLLFSTLLFSVIIFEKGFNGFSLDIINTLGFIVAYSTPVFILEILVRKLLEKQADNKKIYLGIFLRSLSVAFLSVFLYIVAIAFLLRPQGEEGMVYLATPIFYIIFFILNIILSLTILWLERKKENHSYRNAFVIVLSLSFILLVYGSWMLARCEGMGCGNGEYLVERAQRENNPSVCRLAGRTEYSSSPSQLLAPTHRFYSINISDCYDSLATKSNNVELCKLAGYKSSECYSVVAKNLLDPLLCEKIVDDVAGRKDLCFYSIAEKTKDRGLCEKISNTEIRDECKSRVKE